MQAEIIISDFQPSDQIEAKALILSGLVDHWGWLDPTLNPDLTDIAESYRQAIFLVARLDGRMVGTGALKPRGEGVAEIVRMSVAKDLRRLGLGRKILAELVARARVMGLRKIILETTETWNEVIAFYVSFGFRITHHQDGDVYFELLL